MAIFKVKKFYTIKCGKIIFRKMETSESFFWKKHGKLAHLRILAPKISLVPDSMHLYISQLFTFIFLFL